MYLGTMVEGHQWGISVWASAQSNNWIKHGVIAIYYCKFIDNFYKISQFSCFYNLYIYTRQKKKLLAFSFANFKITRWSTGKEWGLLKYPINLVICMQTKIPNSLWISSSAQKIEGTPIFKSSTWLQNDSTCLDTLTKKSYSSIF